MEQYICHQVVTVLAIWSYKLITLFFGSIFSTFPNCTELNNDLMALLLWNVEPCDSKRLSGKEEKNELEEHLIWCLGCCNRWRCRFSE